MIEEGSMSETASDGADPQTETRTNGAEHIAGTFNKEIVGHYQDSEDEHFEEAQSERLEENHHPELDLELICVDSKENCVAQEEKENKTIEKPDVEEKIMRKQVDDHVSASSEQEVTSKFEETPACIMTGTSFTSPNEFNQVSEPDSRVVSNAIPSMNSHANDRFGAVINEFTALTTKDGDKHVAHPTLYQHRGNALQRSIYHRNPSERNVAVPNWCAPSNKPVTNIIQAQPSPPPYKEPMQHGLQKPSVTQNHSTANPTRKISTNTPYVGSHVIASETGPSLTVFLRRPTSERQWGFSFYGGCEFGCPPFVNKVTKNGLAFQQGIEVGDVIVSICKTLTVGKTHDQLKAEMLRAGNDLDLVLIRKGVDLEKLTQIVPQVFQCAARSPPSSVSHGSAEYTTAESPRARSGQSLTRGRSFRSVKTKSIRILEEQLSGGQNPSSVVATKQHFQGARGVPPGGSMSSYTTAYGQNLSQGYAGRQVIVHPVVEQANASNDFPSGYGQHHSSQPNHSSDILGQQEVFSERGLWETSSDYGAGKASGTGGWSGSVSPHGTQTHYSTNHSIQNYVQPATQMSSASMTVPLHGKQAWQTQYM